MSEAVLSRRAQRREQTMQEIRDLAMEQIAASGPEAVSLNGIARAMSMSPAAVYRYFDSRDALLADLVVAVYDSLADALEAAAGARIETPAQRLVAVTQTPAQRFTAVAHAFRSWALDQPNAYRLIFQTTSGSGQDLAPDRTIPAASRSMGALLSALSPLAATTPGETAAGGAGAGGVAAGGAGAGGVAAGAAGAGVGGDPAGGYAPGDAGKGLDNPGLGDEMRVWAVRANLPSLPVRVLALGFISWSRLHGVISLELGHHLASTGIDPALLYEAEIETLIQQASAR
jgi:AcrR family transcriptional regulator